MPRVRSRVSARHCGAAPGSPPGNPVGGVANPRTGVPPASRARSLPGLSAAPELTTNSELGTLSEPERAAASGSPRSRPGAARATAAGSPSCRARSSGRSRVKPGPSVGDLVEDAAGLAEVDRVEVVAVDHAGRAARRRPRASSHFGWSSLVDAPGDVVDGARALQAALAGAWSKRDRAAALLAADLPACRRPCARRPSAARAALAEPSGRRLWARTPSKPCSACSAGISGCRRAAARRRPWSPAARARGPRGRRSARPRRVDRDALDAACAPPRSRARRRRPRAR